MTTPIFTNKALRKMAQFGLSEGYVLDAFNKGAVEKWTNGKGFNAVKKYQGYEIGVAYFIDNLGKYRITTVWKRTNRR